MDTREMLDRLKEGHAVILENSMGRKLLEASRDPCHRQRYTVDHRDLLELDEAVAAFESAFNKFERPKCLTGIGPKCLTGIGPK